MTSPFNSAAEFQQGARPYVEIFNAFCRKHSLSGRTAPDHICFKCGSTESFESLRRVFEVESEFVYQSIIAGRRIAVIKFKTPLVTDIGDIWFLELSDRKPNGPTNDRFDHIEAYPTSGSYADMVGEFARTERVIREERPHHSTDDIDIGNEFLFRCTEGLLVEKIKREEMH